MAGNKCFRRLDKRIRDLKEEVDNLNMQIEEMQSDYEGDLRAAQDRAHYARVNAENQMRSANREAEEIRQEANNRRYDIERAARDVERARDWARITGGDRFGEIDSAIRELKRLSYSAIDLAKLTVRYVNLNDYHIKGR